MLQVAQWRRVSRCSDSTRKSDSPIGDIGNGVISSFNDQKAHMCWAQTLGIARLAVSLFKDRWLNQTSQMAFADRALNDAERVCNTTQKNVS